MRIVLVCVGLVFLLESCSYVASPAFAPGLSSYNGMAADASPDHALLYISSYNGHNVTVYTYRGQHVHYLETLSKFSNPSAECVDAHGNVFITDLGNVYEYPHGGSKPIAVIRDKEGSPTGCSVDPGTGNLAVVNAYSPTGSSGNVLVYPSGHGPPKKYTDGNIYSPQFCAYDDAGNLYIDGYANGTIQFRFAELPKGSRHIEDIAISGGTLHFPGGVVWDRPNVLVADQMYKDRAQSAIFALSVVASKAQVVKVVPLSDTVYVYQFWKQGDVVIAPTRNSFVPIDAYPSGKLVRTITQHIYDPYAAVVSQP